MIGSRLRKFRQTKGFTLDELAQSSKVSRGTIHRIELDQNSPRLDTLEALCKALDIGLDDFFRTDRTTPSDAGPAGFAGEFTGFRGATRVWLEHMEALVRCSADSLTVLDCQGCQVYESEGALQFHADSLDERRTRPWWTCAHPEEQANLQATFETFLEKAEPRAMLQYRVAHQDGSWHWVRTTLSRQLDHPLIQGIIASTQDVTLLKRIEENFHRSQKWESLTTALGGVTHTFSNLLMVVQAHLELAREKQAEENPVTEHLRDMQEALHRVAHLLGQMRDYAGNPILALAPLNLNVMIQNLMPTLKSLGREHHRFLYELDAAIPVLEADGKLMSQLLLDLVANACDALGEQVGTVTIRTAKAYLSEAEIRSGIWADNSLEDLGDCVALEVCDTGCGMVSELLSKLFDPFFTTKFMGRGMGLSTALGTVRTHRGGLRVSSEPGQGSCFQVYLPLSTRQTGYAAPEPITVGKPYPGAILVAEDDEVLRGCIRTMLEVLGHQEILEAENGQQALELYRTHAACIGLVLLDLDMPVMGGVEAFARLRELNPTLRILFSTGACERDPRLATKISAGTTAVLHKPYRMDELKDAMRTLA